MNSQDIIARLMNEFSAPAEINPNSYAANTKETSV
jgi:hypothetical protein